jgi:hypothetical protein
MNTTSLGVKNVEIILFRVDSARVEKERVALGAAFSFKISRVVRIPAAFVWKQGR